MTQMFAIGFGGQEIAIIAAVVVLLFGAKKIPEIAKGLGLGIKEFKKAAKEAGNELSNESKTEPPPEKKDATKA